VEPVIQKTAYIAGALSDMTEEERAKLRAFYVDMAGVCREFGLEPYVPHVYGDPKLLADLTPKQIDRIDRLAVTQAYLVIAYVGVSSTGVGIEIEMAHHSNTPVVILFEKSKMEERRISRLVRANPAVVDEIAFDDFGEALQLLRKFLAKFRKSIASENLPSPLSLPSYRAVINLLPIDTITPPDNDGLPSTREPRGWCDRPEDK
jgi:hypothetical protein